MVLNVAHKLSITGLSRPVGICALLLALPFLTGAEVYRWTDGNGVVNYTQNAPIGVKSEKIRTQIGAPSLVIPEIQKSSAPPEPKLSATQQAMLDKLRVAEDARRAEIARIRDANCQRSRDVLSRLSSRGRVRVRDAEGGEKMMQENERVRRIEEAQQGIATNCTQAG